MGLSRGWDPLAAGLDPTQVSPRKQGLRRPHFLLKKERKAGPSARPQAASCWLGLRPLCAAFAVFHH